MKAYRIGDRRKDLDMGATRQIPNWARITPNMRVVRLLEVYADGGGAESSARILQAMCGLATTPDGLYPPGGPTEQQKAAAVRLFDWVTMVMRREGLAEGCPHRKLAEQLSFDLMPF